MVTRNDISITFLQQILSDNLLLIVTDEWKSNLFYIITNKNLPLMIYCKNIMKILWT